MGYQSALLHRTSVQESLSAEKERLTQAHGRSIMKAVLEGFAGVAPRRLATFLLKI